MLEPHHRAAQIPNEPGVTWLHFIHSRYVESSPANSKSGTLAIVMRAIQQQSQTLAGLQGLVEISWGGSLPVVTDFQGVLNLENREISIQQAPPEKTYDGQLSENGRVMVLRLRGQVKPIYLVHEPTLAQLV
jgi:hypothetical protein